MSANNWHPFITPKKQRRFRLCSVASEDLDQCDVRVGVGLDREVLHVDTVGVDQDMAIHYFGYDHRM